jgi:hypothetical protein
MTTDCWPEIETVAKLHCAAAIFIELPIRGMDEYAAYRGRGPQQQNRQ